MVRRVLQSDLIVRHTWRVHVGGSTLAAFGAHSRSGSLRRCSAGAWNPCVGMALTTVLACIVRWPRERAARWRGHRTAMASSRRWAALAIVGFLGFLSIHCFRAGFGGGVKIPLPSVPFHPRAEASPNLPPDTLTQKEIPRSLYYCQEAKRPPGRRSSDFQMGLLGAKIEPPMDETCWIYLVNEHERRPFRAFGRRGYFVAGSGAHNGADVYPLVGILVGIMIFKQG